MAVTLQRIPLLVGAWVVAIVLASCANAADGSWTDRDGESVDAMLLGSYTGPSDHCDWSSAAFLFIGRSGDLPGVPTAWNDQYVRDPNDLFGGRLAGEFESDAPPPSDVANTGYTNDGMELWFAESDDAAVYVKVKTDSSVGRACKAMTRSFAHRALRQVVLAGGFCWLVARSQQERRT